MVQEHKLATVNVTVVDSIPTEGMKCFIFSFPRSGNESKRSVNLRNSTDNC